MCLLKVCVCVYFFTVYVSELGDDEYLVFRVTVVDCCL